MNHSTKKLTTQEFIAKGRALHGNKYDYSKVVYVNNRTKVPIGCNICGNVFYQKPNDHLIGKGCIKCSGKYKYSNKEFIAKATRVHHNEYDYSNTKYVNSHTEILVICPKHGEFSQLAYHHIRGSKCPRCLHKVSRMETQFLDHLGILYRNFPLPEWKRKRVDGYDPTTHTAYEFLGDYWHGNPYVYDAKSTNPDTNTSYGVLLKRTLQTLGRIKALGYKVVYIWENDWNAFKRGSSQKLRLSTI